MNNLLVAQSGGPTVAINATLVGVLQGAKTNIKVDKIYGAINGIQGILNENFIDLNRIIKNTDDMELLSNTPSSALGSCRFKLDDFHKNKEQYENIIKIFKKFEISYFIYIGGNDSMDTVYKLSEYCKLQGIDDIKIMGAPKTIDNDLAEIDHCPGFGSAAKYIATTFCELERDISVYDTQSVTIVEVMGRNAGWLTASSALSRLGGAIGPSLIYLCETVFDNDKFIKDVRLKLKETGSIIVAVSEGVKDKNGNYISEQMQSGNVDVFGHKYIAGAGRMLENLVRENIGCKVRSIELNLMQRCSSHLASATDLYESKMLGMKAFQCAIDDISGQMASIKRKCDNPYSIEYTSVPIDKIANKEKVVPTEYINSDGNDVTKKMIEYLKPLIKGEINIQYENGIPKHLTLY